MVIGEVLWDCYTDVERLGGAPFNVAHHLSLFGVDITFVSRIGDDSRGIGVLSALRRAGIPADGTQVDYEYPTGRVLVHSNGPVNEYEIPKEQAWDFMESSRRLEPFYHAQHDLVVFGTLAQRSPTSRRCLQGLLKRISAPRFVDLNLRPPFTESGVVENSLRESDLLKVNDDELHFLRHQLGGATEEEVVSKLFKAHRICGLFLTRGAGGSTFYELDRTQSLVKVDHPMQGDNGVSQKVVSTVRAGDAFSAGAILGVLHEWEPDLLLERASRFATEICKLPGAVPDDFSLYWNLALEWGLETPGEGPGTARSEKSPPTRRRGTLRQRRSG